MALVLYDSAGKPLPPAAFTTPFDAGPQPPFPVAYGSRAPLTWQYPLGVNLVFTPRTDEGLPQFSLLRKIASRFDLLSIAIFYRLCQISARSLTFVAREGAKSIAAKKELEDDFKTAGDWWERPDKKNPSITLRSWLMSLCNEVFVTDGVRLMVEETFDGTPSLRQITPENLKPVLDNEGDIVGWQQNVRGIPRTQYPSDMVIAPAFSPQVDSAYGKSHLEYVLTTISIGTQKLLLELANFTESNIPRGFLHLPPEWNQKQIQEYSDFVRREYAGDLAHQARFMLIPGTSKGYTPVHPDTFDKGHEEVLIARICALFSVPRSIFVDSQTRGGSTVTQDALTDSGINALVAYIVNDIVNPFTWRAAEDGGLGLPEVKAEFVDSSTRDMLAVAQRHKLYVDMGAVFPDEVRDELGYAGDSPAAIAKSEAEAIATGEGGEVKPEKQAGAPEPPESNKPRFDSGGKEEGLAKSLDVDPATDDWTIRARLDMVGPAPAGNLDRARIHERRSWRTKAVNRGAKVRFRASALRPMEAWAIRKDLAVAGQDSVLIAKATTERGSRLKLTAAKLVSYRKKTFNVVLAHLASQLAEAKEELHKEAALGVSLQAALRSLLAGVWRDSAEDTAALVGGAKVDFSGFDLGADKYAEARAGELVTKINETTRTAVRELTERAISEGLTPDELARELEGLGVFGPSRAETIARTETAIAQNRGQLDTLRELGITKVRVYDGDFDDECAAADGQIWTIEEAEANPIQHPRCERAFAPLTEEEEAAHAEE